MDDGADGYKLLSISIADDIGEFCDLVVKAFF